MCQYENCKEKVYDNGLCIFHCQKDINSGWIDKLYTQSDDEDREYENKKTKWNTDNVKHFWSEFLYYLLSKYEKEINIVGFIFPIYWITQYSHKNIFEALSARKRLFRTSCQHPIVE